MFKGHYQSIMKVKSVLQKTGWRSI